MVYYSVPIKTNIVINRADFVLLCHIGQLFPTKNNGKHFISICCPNRKEIVSVYRWVMRKDLKANPLLEVDHINGNLST